jgi:G:T-mismatch repair DNA endonuclease (very short patch repair protein)
LVKKYGEKEGNKKYELLISAKKHITSINERRVGKFIRKLLPDHKVWYGDRQYVIYPTVDEKEKLNGKKYIIPDVCVPDLKLIIEYHGDIFHGNPDVYKSYQKPNPWSDLTAGEIRELDRIRQKVLEERGYKVIVIWENNWEFYRQETKHKLRSEVNAFIKKSRNH